LFSFDLRDVYNYFKEKRNVVGVYDVKDLKIARKKEDDWNDAEDIRGLIETRDILEFAAVRNMASVIQETSDKLATLQNSRGGYSRDQAERIFDKIIASPDRNLSQQQKEALERGRNTILNSIDEFNTWRDEHTEDHIYSLLGGRFTKVNRSKLHIDTTRFPGAVVIEATDTETYQAIRGKEKTSLGFYSEDLGEEMLKGRVLVINASEAHDDTDRHEYQHFIFALGSKDVELLPEVSERKIKREEEKSEKAYKKKESKLENEKLDAELAVEEEYENYGRVRSETSKRLSGAETKLRELPTLLATSHAAREVKHRTYPEGPVKDAFTKFRNEFMAYTSGGSKRARFDTCFGDLLKPTQNDPYYEAFQAEADLLKGLLTLAERKGVSNDRIGYLVGSSRSMQQAAKFVYLETQMDEIQVDTTKTAPSEPAPNLPERRFRSQKTLFVYFL